MKFRLLISATLALSTAFTGITVAEDAAAPATEAPEGVGVLTMVTLDATVAAVDHDTREVTLRGSEGKEVTIQVSDKVKNLPQVEVGDHVRAEYYEAVTIRPVAPGDEPARAELSALETAEPGERPAIVAADQSSLVATVENIDKTNQTVTLKGPGGNSKTVKAHNPDNLDKIAVGDHLLITLTTAIAASVTETPPAE